MQRDQWLEEQAALKIEISHLTKGIAIGGDIPALAEALRDRDQRLRRITSQLAQPMKNTDREVLRAALELRTGQWREVLRGQHIAQARLVLQHLIDLPIRVFNDALPDYIKPGNQGFDPRTWNGEVWAASVRPNGLGVGLIQNVASRTRVLALKVENSPKRRSQILRTKSTHRATIQRLSG